MSGPKVIRVRWRLLESAQALDELVSTIEEWRRCLERHGALTREKVATVEAALRKLDELQQAGQWRAVLSRAPAETQALRHEMDELQTAALRQAEQARDRRRRLHAAARTVAEALSSEGAPVPAAIDAVLARALGARDEELADLEGAVDRALSASRRAATTAVTASAAQHELAERLQGDMVTRETVAKRNVYRADPDDRDRRLDRLLAAVEALDDPAVARGFIERAAVAAAEPSRDRRTLLTDSLILDIAAHRKARREVEEATRLLVGARAQLRRLTAAEARTLAARVEAALAHPAVAEAEPLAAAVKTLAATEAKHRRAGETRRAVLQGLAALGYEIHETMATAWAEQGRIVLRRPSSPGYGVELAAAPDTERLQVRVVAFGPPSAARDTRRDADVETVWCSEVERLRVLLGEAGHDTELERAAAPGAVPLKTVSDTTAREERPGMRQTRRSRRLPGTQ